MSVDANHYIAVIEIIKSMFSPVITLHLPYDLMVRTESRTLQKMQLMLLLSHIRFAKKHGIDVIVMHPVFKYVVQTPAIYHRYIDAEYTKALLVRVCSAVSLAKVKLTLETMPVRSTNIDYVEELVDIINVIPPKNRGITVDFAHLYLNDIPLSKFNNITYQIRNVHISGCVDGKDSHDFVTKSDMPIRPCIEWLESIGYEGPLIMELKNGSTENELRSNTQFIHSLIRAT